MGKTTLLVIMVLGLAILGLTTTSVLSALPPNTRSGPAELTLAGKATREKYFVNLYEVGLYVPSPDEKYPVWRKSRGFIVNILYDGSMPDQIPEAWRDELLPALSDIQTKKLKKAFARLKPGDTVKVYYFPHTGSTVAVNGKPVLHDTGPDLVNAFEDIWLGDKPVSTELKQSLLSGIPAPSSAPQTASGG